MLTILTPSVEAGVRKEERNRPRCRTNGKVTVCRMPRNKKPKLRIPPGYYRPMPPIRVPMR